MRHELWCTDGDIRLSKCSIIIIIITMQKIALREACPPPPATPSAYVQYVQYV